MKGFTLQLRTVVLAAALAVGAVWLAGCGDNGTNSGSTDKTSKYKATVSSEGAGSSGGGDYESGAVVTITAGKAPDGMRFKNWTVTSGGVTLGDSTRETTAFTMPKNAVTVTAVFESTMFTDLRDVKTYKTTKIGGKVWMAENLNFATETGSWCYADNPDSCAKYGRLYLWNTAMADEPSSARNPSGVQGVCPAGWHLPSRQEWGDLAVFAGGTGAFGADTSSASKAGKKLKAKTGWRDYQGLSGDGTDDFGFSALPGGYRNSDSSKTVNDGSYSSWWTSTQYDNANAFRRSMWSSHDHLAEGLTPKARFAFSVRCVRDD